MPEETVRERQIRVQKSGGDWENYVKLFLNEKLKGTGVEVIAGKDEEAVKRRSIRIWKMLSMPVKASTVQESAWGDIDLVAVRNEIPVAVISCKTSLHGRFTETLFWSLLFRMLSRTKVVLTTCDAGRGQGKWSSEWGTPENPTKDRALAESYLEGVYVDNVEAFCKNKQPEEKTVLGGVVRNLDELPQDLVKWSDEILRFTYIRKDLGNF